MNTAHWLAVLALVALLALTIGTVWGRRDLTRSLTTGPVDYRGATGAHCLVGQFYYLVPERAYGALIADQHRLRALERAQAAAPPRTTEAMADDLRRLRICRPVEGGEAPGPGR